MFKFLKINKNNIPSLNSLRSEIFDTDFFWFFGLGFCALIFLVIAFIGSKLLYIQYFETYKKINQTENQDIPLNIDRIRKAVDKRNEFINKQVSLPQDPSI